MAEKTGEETPTALPLAAPCHDLEPSQPGTWLARGWNDYRRAPVVSMLYGLLIAGISWSVSALAYWLGSYVLLLAMLSGFVLLAPLLATGLYSISRQIGRGEQPTLRRTLARMRRTLGDDLIFALILLVVFLIWARAGSMVHIFVPLGGTNDVVGMVRFFAIGSAVGAIFAGVTFAVSAFSLPMVVDRDADMITACITSINAVLRNKYTMAIWAAAIMGLTLLSFATAGLGLIVAIPWLGYATWHAYSQTIDASAWPLARVHS